MISNKFFLAGVLAAGTFLSCNNPMQSKEERAAKGAANTPPKATDTNESKSMQLDTTYGDYRISAITRGNEYMRDLILAIGSKKDTTAADTITEKDVKGQLKDLMIADLDGNGKPEVYLAMLSEGTGLYGKIYAFELGKPVVRISAQAIDTMGQAAYRGQDTFYIKGRALVRTFPAFREGEPAALTANTRGIVMYRLEKDGDTLKLKPGK